MRQALSILVVIAVVVCVTFVVAGCPKQEEPEAITPSDNVPIIAPSGDDDTGEEGVTGDEEATDEDEEATDEGEEAMDEGDEGGDDEEATDDDGGDDEESSEEDEGAAEEGSE